MSRPKHVLVMRFAALGDVAAMASVLQRRAGQNPDVQFTILTHRMLLPLFDGLTNVRAVPLDKTQSIRRIFCSLRDLHPTHVIDGHSNLRTICLRTLFFLTGVSVRSLPKYRMRRWRLVRNRRKVLQPMLPWWKVYDRLFAGCGLSPVRMTDPPVIVPRRADDGHFRIGVAPFAYYPGKVWPLEKMKELVRRLSSVPGCTVWLFGAPGDRAVLDEWAAECPGTVNIPAVSGGFSSELEIIKSLHLMISMDSANMHFASWAGVPVVSVWGATHPYAGFYGWRQDPDWAVQIPLECRPCSTNGGRQCRRGDCLCMNSITVDMVMDKVRKVLPELN